MDDIIGYFFEQPRRLIALGRTLLTIGAMVILVGLIGHVATASVSAIHQLGGVSSPEPTLAELYPNLWTWWVPETLLGGVPALILAGVGIWLALLGRKIHRVYHD